MTKHPLFLLLLAAVALYGCGAATKPASLNAKLDAPSGDVRGLGIASTASGSAGIVEAASTQLLTLGADDQLHEVALTTDGTGTPLALVDTPKLVLITVADVA